jgi:hypothetical protein
MVQLVSVRGGGAAQRAEALGRRKQTVDTSAAQCDAQTMSPSFTLLPRFLALFFSLLP